MQKVVTKRDEKGEVEIQKCDECNVYVSDKAAQAAAKVPGKLKSKKSAIRKSRTISIKPTFQSSMSVYITVLLHGNEQGKTEAAQELMNLARQLDESDDVKLT